MLVRRSSAERLENLYADIRVLDTDESSKLTLCCGAEHDCWGIPAIEGGRTKHGMVMLVKTELSGADI